MSDTADPTPASDDAWEGPWRRVFRPRPVVSLIALGMLVVLILLGNWQRRRYYEATGGIAFHHKQHDELPAVTTLGGVAGTAGATGEALGEDMTRLKALQFRRAALTGTLEPDKAQLLTARYMFGERGYGVMMPLKVAGGPFPRVLAHLGWLPQDKVAAYLQEVAAKPERTVTGRLQITVSAPVQKPTGEFAGRPTWLRPFPLGMKAMVPGMEPRLLLQAGELAIGKPVDLKKLPLSGYAHPVRMHPNKHIEYAGTWYGLALTLVFVWIALSLKKIPLRD